MAKKEYVFKLRENMPRGFVNNDRYPELPVIFKFLTQYHNKEFKDTEEFEKVLEGFDDYLKKQNIEYSNDEALREGLYLGKVKNIEDCFVVYTNSNESRARVCQFGLLEKKVEE